MMRGLQLIEEHHGKLAHVLGVRLVVTHAAREASRADEQLTRGAVVAMRLFAGKRLASAFLQQRLANADGGNRQGAQIEIAAESDEGKRGNAHDVGAVATHRVGLHALADVALQNSRKALAEKRELQRGHAMLARPRSYGGQRFGVASESYRDIFTEIRTRRELRFQ